MPIGVKLSSLNAYVSRSPAIWALLLCVLPLAPLGAVDTVAVLTEAPNLETLAELANSGHYEEAARYAIAGQELEPWSDDWEIAKSSSLVALGRYEEALASLQKFVSERSYDIRPRLLLREVALYNGNFQEAQQQKEALGYLINERSQRYSYDPENVVAVGQIALLFDIEPKLVLENFFRRAQQSSDKPVSAFLATGNLALAKDDYKLASKAFQEGLQEYPGNAELLHGLACSYREGDRSKLIEYAEQTLAINPRHAPTHVLMAEHLIAAESYDFANAQLDRALLTNPRYPQALALKAALAYIRNENRIGDELRSDALATWTRNPEVDYRIGQQLSRKYRFSEGASHQRLALELDDSYNPARIQLAQDLLRLGRNAEAWPLAEAVYESDPYNISAFNLTTLRDRLEDFATVESEHFLIRSSREEAAVYGNRAARILEDAHARLTERYGIELPQKTTVEIYPNSADFETRTFGMPGNPGYLGVCFGPVFTINSPATRSANWEAVLYHEFCHTITLTLTNNRMPRWLSEGISVYEEQVANPAWGQRMSAAYRTRILSGQMQPISSMSSAFLQAENGEDVQFAYYQSYLVVEYITQTYGLDPLKALLESLGSGQDVNDALADHLAPLEMLDEGFAQFAQKEASQLAAAYRFESPSGPLAALTTTIEPQKNYTAALAEGRERLAAEEWEEAIAALSELVGNAGYLPGQENAHLALAQAYRGIGDKSKEAAILAEMVNHEANRLSPITRLLELATEARDPEQALRWADAWIAINPMAETPWRALLSAAKERERSETAIEAARALLALEPPDKPSLHFQLAQLTQGSDPQGAKRHVLRALEEAPRFEAAYRLLVKLQADLIQADPNHPFHSLDLDHDFIN